MRCHAKSKRSQEQCKSWAVKGKKLYQNLCFSQKTEAIALFSNKWCKNGAMNLQNNEF